MVGISATHIIYVCVCIYMWCVVCVRERERSMVMQFSANLRTHLLRGWFTPLQGIQTGWTNWKDNFCGHISQFYVTINLPFFCCFLITDYKWIKESTLVSLVNINSHYWQILLKTRLLQESLLYFKERSSIILVKSIVYSTKKYFALFIFLADIVIVW